MMQVSYSVNSFKLDMVVKVIYIGMVLRFEQYPKNALIASNGDVKMKVPVTPTTQQLEWRCSNGGMHPCLIVYLLKEQ